MARPKRTDGERTNISARIGVETRRRLDVLVKAGFHDNKSAAIEKLINEEYRARIPEGGREYIRQERDRLNLMESELEHIYSAQEEARKRLLKIYTDKREFWNRNPTMAEKVASSSDNLIQKAFTIKEEDEGVITKADFDSVQDAMEWCKENIIV